MRTTIQIDCDSGKELLSHLTVIRIQVKAMIEKAKKKDIKKSLINPMQSLLLSVI